MAARVNRLQVPTGAIPDRILHSGSCRISRIRTKASSLVGRQEKYMRNRFSQLHYYQSGAYVSVVSSE